MLRKERAEELGKGRMMRGKLGGKAKNDKGLSSQHKHILQTVNWRGVTDRLVVRVFSLPWPHFLRTHHCYSAMTRFIYFKNVCVSL